MRMQRTIGLSLALFVISGAAMAKQAHAAQHHPDHSVKVKPAKSDECAVPSAGKRHRAGRHAVRQMADRRGGHLRQRVARLAPPERFAPPDRYIGPLQAAGRREVGSASWYGGRHLGRQTASGDRLDAVRATAAHRSLPLHSLVRVTNLNNGRSVVVTITDRGPVSRALLIDVSPSAADQLEMRQAGIVPVSIEPVAEIARAPH